MLQRLKPNERKKHFEIISNIWEKGEIPKSWREVSVCPIPKRNKDPSIILNNRPICLLSVLLKSLEAQMKLHIENHIMENNILPRRSYAFRKGMATSQCINDVINTVYLHKAKGHQVVAACLDIDKAYDRTKTGLLCATMRSLNFNNHIVKWIESFIKDRTLILGRESIKTCDGLAQGSTLSPTLFNIFTASLHEIDDDFTFLFQFADDFFLICIDKDFGVARERLNLNCFVRSVENWD